MRCDDDDVIAKAHAGFRSSRSSRSSPIALSGTNRASRLSLPPRGDRGRSAETPRAMRLLVETYLEDVSKGEERDPKAGQKVVVSGTFESRRESFVAIEKSGRRGEGRSLRGRFFPPLFLSLSLFYPGQQARAFEFMQFWWVCFFLTQRVVGQVSGKKSKRNRQEGAEKKRKRRIVTASRQRRCTKLARARARRGSRLLPSSAS